SRISPPVYGTMVAVCFTSGPVCCAVGGAAALAVGGSTRLPSLADDPDRCDPVADLQRVRELHALHDAPEDRVLPVEPARRLEGDVELAARGVGVAAPRHAERAALVRPLVELGLERVA